MPNAPVARSRTVTGPRSVQAPTLLASTPELALFRPGFWPQLPTVITWPDTSALMRCGLSSAAISDITASTSPGLMCVM